VSHGSSASAAWQGLKGMAWHELWAGQTIMLLCTSSGMIVSLT
jgi:hypothetical protein